MHLAAPRPALMRILDADATRAALPPDDLIAALDAAFREVAEGGAITPQRLVMAIPGLRAQVATMPAYLPRTPALATKVNVAFRANPTRGLPLIQGAVLLSDPEDGRPLALFESGMLTALRTAAAAAVATRALARGDASVLALIGAGLEARTHLEAIARVRGLRDVRVAARTAASAERFAAENARAGFPVRAMGSVREAIEGADIIVTVSTSSDPVIRSAWISPGAHVCGVGSHAPAARELDSDTVARADVVAADTVEGCRVEAGDLLIPAAEGVFDLSRVRALGDALRGAIPGRTNATQLTLYKSVGSGFMDAAAAALGQRIAQERGIGIEVAF